MVLIISIGFFLEPRMFSVYLDQSLRESLYGIIIMFALYGLQFVFYCGIYGCIIDIACEHLLVLREHNFSENLRRHWKSFLVLYLLRLMMCFILFIFLKPQGISMLVISTFFDFIFLFWVVYVFFKQKYQEPLSLPKRKIKVHKEMLQFLIVLTAANFVLLRLAALDPVIYFYLHRVVFYALRFTHFLLFCFFVFIFIKHYPEAKHARKDKQEIYFITPPTGGVFSAVISFFYRIYPPVFAVLKALTPDKYVIKEFNRVIWHDQYYSEGKFVAITSFTANIPEAYKIAKGFKAKGSTVVMGGPHVTFLADEALEYCDSVIVGEAEGVWQNVLEDYEAGQLKQKYVGEYQGNYFQDVFQKIDSMTPQSLSTYVQTGRGCKFNCDFCLIPAISGRMVRKVPLEQFIALISKIKHYQRTFQFLDDNIYVDPQYARRLFEALKPLDIQWYGLSSIDIAQKDDMLKLARESGCRFLLIGYEVSSLTSDFAKKGKFALAKDYIGLSKKVKKAGIKINAQFIYGLDSDNLRTLFDLWKSCLFIFPSITILTLLTPFPGTKVFQDRMKRDRIVSLNWRSYAMNALVLQPSHLSVVLVNIFYPLIFIVFFLTTSSFGLFLLMVWVAITYVF